MIVNKSMFPLQTSFGVISQMQDKFAKLQVQLGTGEKAQKLSEMGRDLPLSLSVRERLNKIDGYSGNIDTVNLRLSFLDTTLTRFDKIEGEARNAATPGQYGTNGINMATSPGLSHARFDEIVTMLNEDVAGRYLFGGKITDKAPLPTTDVLLKGASGKAGYESAVDVRRGADGVNDAYNAGTGEAPGRLTLNRTTDTVTLGEDGTAAHPFGFKLSAYSTTAANTAVIFTPSPTTDATKSLSVQFAAQPETGNTISLGLTMPDGTETQIKLTATTETPAPKGSFTIGATPEDTATNFQAALGASLERTSKTDLKAASVFAAANDFFSESGTPFIAEAGAKPQALVDASATYVQWYSGSVTAPGENPRQSVSTAIDDASRVNYGMQANESGFLRMVRSQAAMAVSSYTSETDVRASFESERLAAMGLPEGSARDDALAAYEVNVQDAYRLQTGFFDGMATRQQAELSEAHNSEPGSIEIITMDLGIARQSLQSATDRHKAYQGQLVDLLSDVETISKEDVAMEIMALQTRLTASYQTTSMVSQLSLVNFLR